MAILASRIILCKLACDSLNNSPSHVSTFPAACTGSTNGIASPSCDTHSKILNNINILINVYDFNQYYYYLSYMRSSNLTDFVLSVILNK